MHPVFDFSPFAFHIPEAKNFYDLLYVSIPDPDDIDLRYRTAGGTSPLQKHQTPDKIWKEALDKLATNKLLQRFCDNLKLEGKFPPLQERLQKVYQAESAVEIEVISEKILILDRVMLRELLGRLADDDDLLKAVIIRGEPDSGKSHCRHLFEKIAKQKQHISIYFGTGIVVELDDAITWLFDQVMPGGSDKIPPKDTSEDAWFRKVCSRLAGLAAQNNKVLWIAMDDLGPDEKGPRLDDAFKRFFDQCITLMPNESFRKYFRLMLIHYPDGVMPTKWASLHFEEEVMSQNDIEQKHVEKFLENWYAKHEKNKIKDDIISDAKKIITDAEAPATTQPPLSRLERIHAGVSQYIKTHS